MKNILMDQLKAFRRQSIRTQSIVLFTILVGFFSVFIYLYFPSKVEKQAMELIEDKARSVALMIAYDLSPTLVFGDKLDMNKILDNARQNKDLAYLIVIDHNYRVFSGLNYDLGVKAKYQAVPAEKSLSKDGLIYRTMCPVMHNEKQIGILYMGLSLEELRARINRSKRTTATVSGFIFILGVGIVFFTSTAITNPLKTMIRTMENISSGDLSHRVDISAGDELSKLALSFNLMIQNLEAYSEELIRLNSNLENEVEERTKTLQVEVNERRMAQEALAKSEEKYRLLVDNSLVGIYITRKNRIMFCNQRFAEIFGFTDPGEVMQKHMSEFLTPQSWNVLENDGVGEGESSIPMNEGRYELKGIKKDGSIFDVETLLHHLVLDQSQSAYEGILLDITKRKLAEAEKLKLESQLRQSQKMESIGTLAGGIAHDFNNILAAILGYTEIAMELVQDQPEIASHLEKIMIASLRARDMVRQILTFSRKSDRERSPVLLTEIIPEVLNLLRSTLPTTIEIRKKLPDLTKRIMGNKSEIHQILMNLCSNAGYAMKENGGILDVKLEEVTLGTERVTRSDLTPGIYQHLIISDTGCGMTPEVVNRIFEPYFTTKKDGEGTGMGLSVVHGIVKSYGGDVSVYSEPGNGTTFNIFLPVVDDPPSGKPIESGNIASPEVKPVSRGKERILLVDDDPFLVDLEKQILERLGYKITASTCSLEALKIFQTENDRFDMVISDQTMPRLTGIQLASEIKKINPEIPFILCSGFSESVNEDTYKTYGIDAYLMKPIGKDHLVRAIRDVLDHNA